MKKKATAKKAVSKKAAKRSAPPIPGMVKIHYNGEEMKQNDFYATKASELGIAADDVKGMFLAIAGGATDFEENPELSTAQNKKLNKAFSQLTKDWESHQDAAAEAKEKREAEKAAKAEERAKAKAEKEKLRAELKERKEKMSLALTTAKEETTAVAKPLAATVDKSVGLALGSKFKLKDGKIVASKQATEEDWAAAFGAMENLIATSSDLRDRFCVREAQLAIAAEAKYGAEWANFFSDKPSDIARIKKYVKVVREVPEEFLEAIPMNNIRALTEARYSEDKEKNEQIKGSVLKKALSEFKKKGKFTQARAKELANESKETKKAKEKIRFVYVLYFEVKGQGKIVTIGTAGFEPLYAKAAMVIIDLAKKQIVNVDQTLSAIEPPSDKIIGMIKKVVSNKDAEEAFAGEEEEEEEEDEDVIDVEGEEVEEEEEEDEDVDADEEEDDEEEESDDDEEEEEESDDDFFDEEEEEEDEDEEEEEDDEFEDL